MTASFIPQQSASPHGACVCLSATEVLHITRSARTRLVQVIESIENGEVAAETARRAAFNERWLVRRLPVLRRSMDRTRIRQSCPSLSDGLRSDMSRRFHYLHLVGTLRVATQMETEAASGVVREFSVPLKTWSQIRAFGQNHN